MERNLRKGKIGLWDFQDDKCSIIHKYADDEVSKLVNKKEIPPNFKVSSEEDFNEDDNYFDYSQISDTSSDEEEEEDKVKKADDWTTKSTNSAKSLPYRHNEGVSVIDIDDI